MAGDRHLGRVKLEKILDLSEEDCDYNGFIDSLRELFIGEGSVMISDIQTIGTRNEEFIDATIYLVDGDRFIELRFQTGSVYFIGYTKGTGRGENKAYTLNEWYIMHDKTKIVPGVLTSEREEHWAQVNLEYSSSYEKLGLGRVEKTNTSKFELNKWLTRLHDYNPNSRESYDSAKKGCGLIAKSIAEPVRFCILKSRIAEKWNRVDGYTFSREDDNLIHSWADLATFLTNPVPTPTQEDLDDWDREPFGDNLVKKTAWEDYKGLKDYWDSFLVYYKITAPGEYCELCSLLKLDVVEAAPEPVNIRGRGRGRRGRGGGRGRRGRGR